MNRARAGAGAARKELSTVESTEARLERRERELCAELEQFGPRPVGDRTLARERDRMVAKLNAVRKLLMNARQYRFNFGGG